MIMRARDHQFFGGETRDDFVAGFGDHDLFLDARGAPAVFRRPEGFEREHHSGFDFVRMFERNQAADHGLFPNGQPDAVAELQSERGLFVGESELLRLGPDGGDFRGGAAGADQRNGRVQIFAAALVGVHQRVRAVTDGEAAVVTGAVAHEGMQDVVVDRIAGAQHAIGENVRVRIAALARDRVDAFDVFRPQVVEHLVGQPDGFVLAEARFHGAIKFVVGRVHHHGGGVEQRDLVLRFDDARVGHELLAIDHRDAFALQGK